MICPILVGRAPHLAALDACLERTATGQRQVLLVTGEAGIGKTRLVGEASARARGRGFQVVQGICFETDRGLPYAPFLDLLNGVADSNTAQQLASLLQERPSSASASEIDFTRRRISQAFAALFKQLAAVQPVLLVLEDLHWSDEASIELTRILVRELASSPVLLLLTYRSDEVSPALRTLLASLDRTRVAFEIALQPLTLSEIDDLLGAVFALDRPARTDFLDLIGKLSEGNPFFIEEILSALIARGEIFFESGRWDRKPLPELHVPRSVWEAVQQLSANLSSAAAELLVLAAVVGRRFSLGLLQMLSGQDDSTLIESIKELLAAGLVVEESAEQCAFRHALTREAVYGGLLGRERQALHRRVAELIESLHGDQLEELDDHLDLAHHYFEGAVWDKALRFGAAAGERALALYAPRAAIEQLSRALDAAGRSGTDPVPVLSHARGLAHEMLGDFDAAREDLEATVDGASAHGDEALLWRALLDLGLLWAGRDYARTGTYVQQALELARRLGDEASVAHSLNRVGNWHMNVQQIDEALACHHEALAMFDKLADRRGVAETLDLLGATSQQATDPARAAEFYDRALPLLRDLDDRQRLINVLVLRTVLEGAYTIDRIAPGTLRGASALHDAEAALTMAREIGWRAGESFVAWELALYLGPRGEYTRALELAGAALTMAEEIDHRQWVTGAHCALSALHLDLLVLTDAREHAEHALHLAAELGSPIWVHIASAFFASSLVAQGELTLAAEALGADGPMQTMGQRLCWYARAELALARREPDLALEITHRLAEPPENAQVVLLAPRLDRLRADALAALGKLDEAEAALLEGRNAADVTGERSHSWRISAALQRVQARQHRASEADEASVRASQTIADLAEAVPAGRLRETFRQEALRRLPQARAVNESRAAKALFGGLTSREREVAALVARGLSNRAIADELVVGERTVETYVSSILSKLGYTSRTQIAAWSVQRGLANPR